MDTKRTQTTESDREALRGAMLALHCHEDFAEILDVRDEATGRRVGFVVRMRGGREFEVKVRTGRPTVDTWDDEGWGGKVDADEPAPHEPFFDDPNYASPKPVPMVDDDGAYLDHRGLMPCCDTEPNAFASLTDPDQREPEYRCPKCMRLCYGEHPDAEDVTAAENAAGWDATP